MWELAFSGPGGHVYRAPVRFVQEPDGRLLLQELPYSFFWDVTGQEVQLARSAAPVAVDPATFERFRAALAARALLRPAAPLPAAAARAASPPRAAAPLAPPEEDDGRF